MRLSNGFQQPCRLVRIVFAFFCGYFVFSGLGLGQAGGFDEQAPDYWTAYTSVTNRQGNTVASAQDAVCGATALTIQDSYAYDSVLLGGNLTCRVRSWVNGNQTQDRYFAYTYAPQCGAGFIWAPNDGDTSGQTGKCKRPKCIESSESCYLSSQTPISSVATSVCVTGCVVAQTLGPTEERYVGGVQIYYYQVLKAHTSSRCYVVGGATPVACNSGAPTPQDPCALPGASTNPQCGGSTGGCPPGTTVLANGSCTPNDAASPCPAGSYRIDGHGACVPYPGGDPGNGGNGSGAGAAGVAGSGGNSGGAGGTGGSGGAGSSSGGGGGGGQGGQGGGGGAGGAGGGGGQGGDAGKGAECGPGKMLCEDTFQTFFTAVKDFFKGDVAEEAEGKAEIAKSRTGGYVENPLNKGPIVDLGTLSLDVSGGSIGGGHACPASRTISIKGTTFALSFGPLCDFAGYIRAVLLLVCSIASARIVFGAWN